MSNDETFDFFISYTKADERWAEWIAWQLEDEAKPPYRVFLQAWDFHAGGDFVHEMQKATTKASRTIAVLSPSFLQAKFTQSEWQAAFAKDPTGELGLLVPVRVAECKPEGLLKARIYIDLTGLDEERARAKLLKSISGERVKPDVAPQFPTTSASRSEPSFPGPSSEQIISAQPPSDDVPVTHTSSSPTDSGSAGPVPPGHKHSTFKYWIVGIVALLIIAALLPFIVDFIRWGPQDPMLGSYAGEARQFSNLKITMLWCPPGTFKMGDPSSDAEESDFKNSQVGVTLSRGFWLGQTEVTQGQWEQLMGTTPWKGKLYVKEGSDYPAVYVSHGMLEDGTVETDSAMEFCRKLTESERAVGRLPDGWEYTLPTEAQWEYACRAGTKTRFSFGDDANLLDDYAWYESNTRDIGNEYAHEVKTRRPNPWGFHDLHGNVWEWCLDGFSERLPGGRDPLTQSGSGRVYRGGSWLLTAGFARSAFRNSYYPSYRSGDLGFRLALSPLGQ